MRFDWRDEYKLCPACKVLVKGGHPCDAFRENRPGPNSLPYARQRVDDLPEPPELKVPRPKRPVALPKP